MKLVKCTWFLKTYNPTSKSKYCSSKCEDEYNSQTEKVKKEKAKGKSGISEVIKSNSIAIIYNAAIEQNGKD